MFLHLGLTNTTRESRESDAGRLWKFQEAVEIIRFWRKLIRSELVADCASNYRRGRGFCRDQRIHARETAAILIVDEEQRSESDSEYSSSDPDRRRADPGSVYR